MKIPLTFPQKVKTEELNHLRELHSDITEAVKIQTSNGMSDGQYYPEAYFNYQNKMCRLIHYFVCHDFAEKVHEQNYNQESLEEYFLKKIELQRVLYHWEFKCNGCGRLIATVQKAFHETLDPKIQKGSRQAACIIRNDKELTQQIVDYVNRQEKLFFSRLPQNEQCHVSYQVYRDRFVSFLRSPEALLTGAMSLIVMMFALAIVTIDPKG